MKAVFRLLQPLLIKLALRFSFDYLWDEIITYLARMSKRTDTLIDDNGVKWIDTQKQDIESFIRQRLGYED